jgi:arylsulfatase A-like enzyme
MPERPTRRDVLTGLGAAAVSGCSAEPTRWRGPEPDPGDPPPPIPSFDTARYHSEPGTKQPNVLILFPDQLRAQACGAEGERNIATPAIDGIFAGGTAIDGACTSSPVCTPARASLWTGLYPYATGTSDNGSQLPADAPSLAAEMRSVGYSAGYVGKWHLRGNRHHGFIEPERRHGFLDYWAAHNMGHSYLNAAYWTDSEEPVYPEPRDTWEPVFQTDLGIGFIEDMTKQGKPWFLSMCYGPPHPNGNWPVNWAQDVPAELFDRVDPASIQFRPNVPDWIKEPSQGQYDLDYNDPFGARRFFHGYYACILGVDEQLARILGALTALGIEEETLVVFASDHGEMGGAHGMYKKGNWLEESIRIPMVFRWPGTIAANKRLVTPATLVDLMPTLLGIGGWGDYTAGHGRDLSGQLLHGTREANPPLGAYITRGEEGDSQRRALRTEHHKYGEALGHPELNALYDLVADPYELTNLYTSADHTKVRVELAAELMRWRIATDDPSL